MWMKKINGNKIWFYKMIQQTTNFSKFKKKDANK